MGIATGRISATGRVSASDRVLATGRVSAASRRDGACDHIGNGLIAYYRNDPETITLTSGRVSKWADLSGNGYHAVQATSSRRPTITSNWSNGLDGLAFGTSRVLGIPFTLQTTRFPITLGGVFQSTDNSAFRTIWAPTSALGGCTFSIHTFTSTTRDFYSNSVGGAIDGNATTNIEVWIGTVEIYVPNNVLATLRLYLGTSNTEQSLVAPTRTVFNPTGQGFIGAVNSSAQQAFVGGTIGELFFMNRLMTTSERVRYCSYVQSRYGTI